jgi:hypothetical protein
MNLPDITLAVVTGAAFSVVLIGVLIGVLKDFLSGFFKKAGEDAYAAIKERWQWVWLAMVWGLANAIPAYFVLATNHPGPVSGRELSNVINALWIAAGLALLCLFVVLLRIIRLLRSPIEMLAKSQSDITSTVRRLSDTHGRMINTQGRLIDAVGTLAEREGGEQSADDSDRH